jgi:hypothetical protein
MDNLVEVGQKLAAQLGGVFTINPRKVADYKARKEALRARETAIR